MNASGKLLIVLLVLFMLSPVVSVVAYGEVLAKPEYRIIFHHDCASLREAPPTDTVQFLRDWFNREADLVPMTTFCLQAALPDLCTFDSKVGEVFGDRKGLRPAGGQWYGPPIRALRAQGTDVLKIAISQMRPRGIEVLAAVRMSDTHYTHLNPTQEYVPQFALDHPEYVIQQPADFAEDHAQGEVALDYSHPEVRAHRLAIKRELAEEYDIDGLELDFTRWGKHFPRDQGKQKAPIMTSYVGEVRKILDEAAKKRGCQRLTLGARVPEEIRACWMMGIDVETWIKSGWFDYLTVATHNETDPQVRVDEFIRLAEGTDCQITVAMGNMMGTKCPKLPRISGRGVAQMPRRPGYGGMLLTAPEARACAANYYAWGARGISFWNVCCNMGTKGKFSTPANRQIMKQWTNAVISPNAALAGPRRYHYLPMFKWPGARNKAYAWSRKNTTPLGVQKTQVVEFLESEVGRRKAYKFRMADGRNGETLTGTLRFRVFHVGDKDRVTVDINGEKVNADKIKRIALDAKQVGLPGFWYEIDLADCPSFQGDNELGLTLVTQAQRAAVPYMEELDILVQ